MSDQNYARFGIHETSPSFNPSCLSDKELGFNINFEKKVLKNLFKNNSDKDRIKLSIFIIKKLNSERRNRK